jgi:predicted O-methyltransferase YrrM
LGQCAGSALRRVSIAPAQIRAGHFSDYLNRNETSILIDLVKGVSPKVMIEFGCNLGVTAKRVLENVPTLERYVGVDVEPDHVPTLGCQLSEVPERAGAYAADDQRFFLLTSPSTELDADDLERCDAVFIDGDHSEAVVSHESMLARELVRKGGIIIWHDYGNPSVEVTKVLDRLGGTWPITSVDGSWLAFMRT